MYIGHLETRTVGAMEEFKTDGLVFCVVLYL